MLPLANGKRVKPHRVCPTTSMESRHIHQRLERDRAQADTARPSEGSAICPTIVDLRALHFFFVRMESERRGLSPLSSVA
jgi:hypothetical protein